MKLLKQKRIETLKRYIDLKIFEEGGQDIRSEFAILISEKTNTRYAFDDLISFHGSNQVSKKAII